MITDLPRTTTRAMWKWLYRSYRITCREQNKVFLDVLIAGSGAWRINADLEMEHIPISEVTIDREGIALHEGNEVQIQNYLTGQSQYE